MYAHVRQKSGNDRRRVLDSDSDIGENENSDDDSDETDECHRDATLCKTGCVSAIAAYSR